MANTNAPFGLLPKRHLSGAPWNGQVSRFAVLAADGAALFKGDLVKSAGTADANGVKAVARASADTDQMVGVVVGFEPDFSNLNTGSQYRAASTLRYVLVCTDPTVIYEVQCSGSSVIADIGLNVGLTYTAGSATTGVSAMVALQSTVDVTVTLPLKIFGWVQRPDVDTTDATNMKLEVLVNNAALATNVVGV
jgi:hypothetical protein